MDRLRHMSIFAYIVEAGSISAAADKLDLSKSVISQHLKTLEEDLGGPLLKRTTRRQSLTPMGEDFYLKCRDINAIAQNAWENAQDYQQEPAGPIRITAPNALMDVLVTPVMAELMKKYPKLQPTLISEDQRLDFMEYGIDLAIRVGPSKDISFKQKKIGEFRDILCGTAIFEGQDITTQPYIANSWQGKEITHLFKKSNGEEVIYKCESNCITNSFHNCVSLIKAGAGIGILPDFYLSKMGKNLVNLMPDMSLPLNPVFVLNPFPNKPPLAVEICIKALGQQLKKV